MGADGFNITQVTGVTTTTTLWQLQSTTNGRDGELREMSSPSLLDDQAGSAKIVWGGHGTYDQTSSYPTTATRIDDSIID